MDVKGLLKAVGEDGFLKHVSCSQNGKFILSSELVCGLIATAVKMSGSIVG